MDALIVKAIKNFKKFINMFCCKKFYCKEVLHYSNFNKLYRKIIQYEITFAKNWIKS